MSSRSGASRRSLRHSWPCASSAQADWNLPLPCAMFHTNVIPAGINYQLPIRYSSAEHTQFGWILRVYSLTATW